MFLPTSHVDSDQRTDTAYFEAVFHNLAPGTAIEYTVQCAIEGQPLANPDSPSLTFEIIRSALKVSRRILTSTRATIVPDSPGTKPSEPPADSNADRNSPKVLSPISRVMDVVAPAMKPPSPADVATNKSAATPPPAQGEIALTRPVVAQPQLSAISGVRVALPAMKIKSGNETTTVSSSIVAGAWQRNSGLDLLSMDLSRDSQERHNLDLSGLGEPERKAFIRDVAVRRHVVTATGNVADAEKLLSKGITSVADTSPLRIAQLAEMSPARARVTQDRDIHTKGQLAHGLFSLLDAYGGGLQKIAVGNIRPQRVLDFIRPSSPTGERFDGLDNLQELFGNLDSCDCKQCNSILGPAAYFVDLMYFVQTHVLADDAAKGDGPFKGKQSHPLHLKVRRPDLWTLPLTCENTHTEIPQLQISSEIFENYIASKRNIAVTPDRSGITAAVYGNLLPAARHSVRQPFFLPIDEISIYLSHYRLTRADIAHLLGVTEEERLRTSLGITTVQSALLITSDATATNIQQKLHLAPPANGIFTMRQLLNATQLSRANLGELLTTRYVGGSQPLTIVAEKQSADSVQFDIERVHGITSDHLDRIHRLLRLQSHLPWLPREIDALIQSTGSEITERLLADAARATLLKSKFKSSVAEICACAGTMPDFPVERPKRGSDPERTPYDILFNAPDLMRSDGRYPNAAKALSVDDTSEIAQERIMRIRAGLRLTDAELTVMVEQLNGAVEAAPAPLSNGRIVGLLQNRLRSLPRPILPPSQLPLAAHSAPASPSNVAPISLTCANLSLLLRHATIARWFKLSPMDLFALLALSPLAERVATDLSSTLQVIEFHDWFKDSRISLDDLALMLCPAEALSEQLSDLSDAMKAWLTDQDQSSLTDTFLTQIEGISEDMSRVVVTTNIGKVFKLDGDRFQVLANSSDADLDVTSLQGTTVDLKAVRRLIQSYHPNDRLPRALSQAVVIDVVLARQIIAAALSEHPSVRTEDFLREGSLSSEVTSTIVAILRLLKVVTCLRLGPDMVPRLHSLRGAFGITDWANLNPTSLQRLVMFRGLLKGRVKDTPMIAFDHLDRLAASSSKLNDVAACLFNLELSHINNLLAVLPRPTNCVDALFKLSEYSTMTRKLGVDATALAGMISEDYAAASSASAALLAGLRAKYSDDTAWQEIVAPFQNKVLEKKRDALVDYLLRGPSLEFKDSAEMYKYFLIDGEVDGCFLTSRVVAACSSLQLYVHRIRMNLEKDAAGTLHVLPSLIPDEEWEWRQHYRMFEANRKIFLWPENYLDPSTIDRKTPLYEEFESQLLQQEISDQSVIDAYSGYLKSFEELTQLRYAGAFHHYQEDDESSEVTDVIYLFGATGGDSPTHYWREIRNLVESQKDDLVSPEYGPWRKIEARIPSRMLTPTIHNGLLHVFWNEIATTSQNAVEDGKSRFIGYSHRYSLKFTALRLDGEWTPPGSVSLQDAGPAFHETDCSIDDPLADGKEISDLFKSLGPLFGSYSDDSRMNFDDAIKQLLTPRWALKGDLHTKAREGYKLSGFLWERPYVSADPTLGDRLLVNCAGLLVRGALDLFDREVSPFPGVHYNKSGITQSEILACSSETVDYELLRRDGDSLKLVRWSSCPFDLNVATAITLNEPALDVFKRHWGDDFVSTDNVRDVASLPGGARAWAIDGTPSATIVETDQDILLLLPSATAADQFAVHRLGTTLVREVARKLYDEGLDGMLATRHQLDLVEPSPSVSGARAHDMTVKNPLSNDAAYSQYYQEVFLLIPNLIAYHLNAQGKFEQARRWYQYIFDPTSPEPPTTSDDSVADRNWKYRQFRGLEQAKLRDVLSDTAALTKYREDPFNAHAIARLRISAYQKAIVMQYIDNLLDHADARFTTFQMESVNEAMMLYVTAAEILGPKPITMGECGEASNSSRTYDKLKDLMSQDGQILLEIQELIPRRNWAIPAVGGFRPTRPLFGLRGTLDYQLNRVSRYLGPQVTSATGTSSLSALAGNATHMGTASEKPASALHGNVANVVMKSNMGARPAMSNRFVSTGPAGNAIGRNLASSMTTRSAESTRNSNAGSVTNTLGSRWGRSISVIALSPDLARTFASRQRFKNLGGQWLFRAGRVIPSTLGDRFSRAMVRHVCAAFCIPRNEILEGYWQRVEDRIMKIRTCRDISGQKRKLSLFAPPIDPMLLARARAAGIALDDIVGAYDGSVPTYRFSYLLQKAKEFAGTVQSFGSALQAALERKDTEELVRLQSTQQQHILELTRRAKAWELSSATANYDSTVLRKQSVENRRAHYAGLLDAGLNEWEQAEAAATHIVSTIKAGSATISFLSGSLGLIPQVGSPFSMKYGGAELKEMPAKVAFALQMLAEVAGAVATSAALEGRNARRREDWQFQRDQSLDELAQLDKQILAAQIARDLAEHSIIIHEKNIEHNEELLEYHEGKFSSLGFYTWLATQLQRLYHEAFNMAFRMARFAEQAYRFEREDYSSELLGGQYWEAPRAGLLAGNRLTLDLQLLEQKYIETDTPKRELVDQFFSLRQWDPRALVKFWQTGECEFRIPELYYDLISPGDYRRRFRSLRLTIPAVAGPYTNVVATLTLLDSQMRYDPTRDLEDAPRPRVDSISTSSARNDAGTFELNFKAEKYVPFEGAGAISHWRLSMPTAAPLIDRRTISDIILHLDYTASFDGLYKDVVQGVTAGIVASIQDRLASDGIDRVFSIRDEFPLQYARLSAGEAVDFELTLDQLPFYLRQSKIKDAALTFTDLSAEGPSIGPVEFNGRLIGEPTVDPRIGAPTIPIDITGGSPWKLTLKVTDLPKDVAAWLIFKFVAEPA